MKLSTRFYSLCYARRILLEWTLRCHPCSYLEIQWEPRDVWTGVYWKWEDCFLDVFVCLIPTIVFHVALNVDLAFEDEEDTA